MDNAQRKSVSAPARADRAVELASLIILLKRKALKAERLTAEVEHFGAVATLERFATDVPDSEIAAAVATAQEWLSRGYDVRTVADPTYPLNLSQVFNKPPLIFVSGRWNEGRDSLSVAVVGTRKPTAEGLKRATAAGKRLAKEGITVLSGLAAGIDAAAHTAALDAGGRTVAVMGTGLDHVYPKENRALAERIVASGGALLTQFFPDQPPTQWTFPMRNVVMSGLSLATFVIEAGETSGARQQARHALEHGRTVFLAATLVSKHEWARKMVSVGLYGARAIPIDSIEEVVERIVGSVPAVAAM